MYLMLLNHTPKNGLKWYILCYIYFTIVKNNKGKKQGKPRDFLTFCVCFKTALIDFTGSMGQDFGCDSSRQSVSWSVTGCHQGRL